MGRLLVRVFTRICMSLEAAPAPRKSSTRRAPRTSRRTRARLPLRTIIRASRGRVVAAILTEEGRVDSIITTSATASSAPPAPAASPSPPQPASQVSIASATSWRQGRDTDSSMGRAVRTSETLTKSLRLATVQRRRRRVDTEHQPGTRDRIIEKITGTTQFRQIVSLFHKFDCQFSDFFIN